MFCTYGSVLPMEALHSNSALTYKNSLLAHLRASRADTFCLSLWSSQTKASLPACLRLFPGSDRGHLQKCRLLLHASKCCTCCSALSEVAIH